MKREGSLPRIRQVLILLEKFHYLVKSYCWVSDVVRFQATPSQSEFLVRVWTVSIDVRLRVPRSFMFET